MNTEEAKPEAKKTAAALVEAIVNCPCCGRAGQALYESQSECCRLYLSLWFTCYAA